MCCVAYFISLEVDSVVYNNKQSARKLRCLRKVSFKSWKGHVIVEIKKINPYIPIQICEPFIKLHSGWPPNLNLDKCLAKNMDFRRSPHKRQNFTLCLDGDREKEHGGKGDRNIIILALMRKMDLTISIHWEAPRIIHVFIQAAA